MFLVDLAEDMAEEVGAKNWAIYTLVMLIVTYGLMAANFPHALLIGGFISLSLISGLLGALWYRYRYRRRQFTTLKDMIQEREGRS